MSRRRRVGLGFSLAAVGIVLALVFLVSPFASSQPDGLNRVAADHGLSRHERASATADLPTAGYAVRGVDDHGLSRGLAGLIGVTVTLVLTGGVLVAVRRRARPTGRVPDAET